MADFTPPDLLETASSVTMKLPPPRPADPSVRNIPKGPPKNVTKWSPPKEISSEDLNPVTHAAVVAGEGALHALPDTAGFFGDLLLEAYKGAANAINRARGSDEPQYQVKIPGTDAVSQRIAESFGKAEQDYLKEGGLSPDILNPKNKAELYANRGTRGAADVMLAGSPAGMPGRVVASGVSAGVAGEAAHEAFPNSEVIPAVISIAAGALPFAIPHAPAVRAGMEYANYEPLRNTVLELEGGGTLDRPNVNPKTGARGPMQVTPETARQPGYGIKPWDGKSEADLARVGEQKLAVLNKMFNGDEAKVLAAYNWGEGNVRRVIKEHGDRWFEHIPDETKQYLQKGLDHFDLATREKGVPPIPPEELANIMNDPEAVGARVPTPEELGGGETIPPPSNVVDISEEMTSNMIDRLYQKTADMRDRIAEGNHTADIGRLEKTREDINNELMTYPHSEGDRDALIQIDDILKESIALQGGKPRLYELPAETPYLGNYPEEPRPAANDQSKFDKYDAPVSDADKYAAIVETEIRARELRNDPEWRAKQGLEDADNVRKLPTNTRNLGDVLRDLAKDTGGAYRDPYDRGGGLTRPEGTPDNIQGMFEKLNDALNQARPARAKQESLYSKERSNRLNKLKEVRGYTSGLQGFLAEKAVLQGELPKAEGPVINLTMDELVSLFDHIKNHPNLSYYGSINAREGLAKMLTGKVPTKNEIAMLNRVLPPELMKNALKQRSLLAKTGEAIANIGNIPKALMASYDISAPLRQGAFMIGRKEWWKSLIPMVRAFGSEKYAAAVRDNIYRDPLYNVMDDAGLAVPKYEGHNGGPPLLEQHEEPFQTNLANKIPLVGLGVRASERAYNTFLYKVRAETFRSIYVAGKATGKIWTEESLRDLARFINSFTGRGDMGKFNNAGPLLNVAFFSPRLLKSRIDAFNPVFYANLDPFVRHEAMKSMLAFTLIATTVLGLAKLSGAEVSPDIRTPDGWKIKVGNTRYDILGGSQQLLRLYANVGSYIYSKGKQLAKTGQIKTGYNEKTAADNVGSFFRNKESPDVSLLHDFLAGRNAVGQPFKPKQELLSRVTPLSGQDWYAVAKDLQNQGVPVDQSIVQGFAMTLPGLPGVGLQTYPPKPPKTKSNSKEFGSDFSKDFSSDFKKDF